LKIQTGSPKKQLLALPTPEKLFLFSTEEDFFYFKMNLVEFGAMPTNIPLVFIRKFTKTPIFFYYTLVYLPGMLQLYVS